MTTDLPKEIAIVVIVDQQNGIGKDGGLLCHLPNDLKHFKNITTRNTIIMGRRTYESLPKGALPNRRNIVITSDNAANYPGCVVVRTVGEALSSIGGDEKAFIIGGGKLYSSTFHLANKLYLTRIHHSFVDADTFFPTINYGDWELIEKEDHEADEKHKFNYSFLTYKRFLM